MSRSQGVPSAFTATIPGIPRPQGSLKIITSRSTGKPFAKYSDTTIQHRNLAVGTLMRHWDKSEPLDGPVELEVWFYLPRPKAHYGTGKNARRLRPGSPEFPITTPDTDKLLRAVFDAHTVADVLRDDSLIVSTTAHKRYDSNPRTVVTLTW